MAHPIDELKMRTGISDEVQQSLKALTIERHYHRGDILADAQMLRNNAIYIIKGSARAFYVSKGRERTYSFAFDDEFVTKPISLFHIPDATLSIEFLEPTDAILLPVEDLKSLMDRYSKESLPHAATYIISMLVEHSQTLEERLLVFQSLSATERYQWLISTYPTLTKRATLTQIASFLGITKETIYRIRAGKYQKKQS